jgi:phosphopantothenoylcysteine decarboxylase / phosphopantothenate---cysteine ligase
MKRIVLGISASAALYKACDLASRLNQEGDEVRCVLTPNAAKLIAPQLFEAVSGQLAYVDEFGPSRRGAMDHIELGRWAEILVVAPASADLIGQLAAGLAGNLLTTLVLATDPSVPRLLCPAMNPTMYASAPVVRNVARLVEDGWNLVEPETGHVACGEEGPGRLAEVARIAGRIAELRD